MEENKAIYRIFFSWQADNRKVKDAISAKLEVVKDTLHQDGWHIEIDQDTSGRVGTQNIDKEVLAKIRNCDVFVADVTPIYVEATKDGKTPKKLVSNPNVMYESGYALGVKGLNRMIFLASLKDGETPERMPFDINHNTITNIKNPEKLKSLPTWVKAILEEVKKEREQQVKELDCRLLFRHQKQYVEKIVLNPIFYDIQYIPQAKPKSKPIQEKKPWNPFGSSMLSLQTMASSRALEEARVAQAETVKIVKPHYEKDHSSCPVQFALENVGKDTLVKLSLQVRIETEGAVFEYDNESGKGIEKVQFYDQDYRIEEDGKHLVYDVELLHINRRIYLDKVYIKVPHGVSGVEISWAIASVGHYQHGKKTIEVEPKYYPATREDDTRVGQPNLKVPYIEECEL